MCLIKTITNANGVATTYHRISSITKNGARLLITISSYISEEYRNKEKEYYIKVSEYTQKAQRYTNLISKHDLTEDEKSEIKSLEKWLNEYSDTPAVNYAAAAMDIEMTWVNESLSFADIYSELKANGIFAGALDG